MAISAPLTGTRPVDPNAVKNTLGVYKTPLIEVSTKCAFTNTTQGFPLDGFYEWKKIGTGKQPYAIALADRRLMARAGLWET